MKTDTDNRPDLLVFLSDQHTARIVRAEGDEVVETPNIDRLYSEGRAFSNTYTSCPLCVPARMSMLSGHLPSRTGIFTNSGTLPSDHATFAHCLGAAGYETVLCGRMHFLGPDQLHGFSRRLVGDFTPCYLGRYGMVRSDLGPYVGTPAGKFDKLYGGGTSPVLEYDRAVVDAALEYLRQPHDKPFLLVVGIYGPHHTFVAPEPLYRKYLDALGPPRSSAVEDPHLHPFLRERRRGLAQDVVRCLRAAYYGLVEHVDSLVGETMQAMDEHLAATGRRGTACYLSDHGELAGERGLWGKMTFYEESARIPLIFRGHGVRPDSPETTPSSIMDLGPTLCELAGVPPPPEQDGISLVPALVRSDMDPGRRVFSEMLPGGRPARMVRVENWKYISYDGIDADELFDLAVDPDERVNRIGEHPDVAARLAAVLAEDWDPDAIRQEHERLSAHQKIIGRWGAAVDVPEPYRWKIPRSAWALPHP